ncbi:hypothetical protein OE88DRAFT_1658489 [Heliocybe sulcata]|uniref:Uncharacterized protein n=1 Tax=Heliocybe sulcata TaxID=5364 RepID=A0A5C3N3K5_9AGAM|nr:hypothetical protein OE88DRAFT_1658489 [Heliocybe sulcata]
MIFETNDERLALPDPTFLRIRASRCRVAHLAGVAKYYDQLENGDEYHKAGAVPAEALMRDVLTARLYDMISQNSRGGHREMPGPYAGALRALLRAFHFHMGTLSSPQANCKWLGVVSVRP